MGETHSILLNGSIFDTIIEEGAIELVKIEKLFQQIINNQKSVSFEIIDRILLYSGFSRRQPKGGSSHYTYYHPETTEILTIPYSKPVKVIYIKKALAVIEKLNERRERN